MGSFGVLSSDTLILNCVMKKLLSFVALALLVVSCGPKVELVAGSASPLKRIRTMNVVFDYEDMKVGDMDEEDYLSEKVREKNSEERGSGDAWRDEWFRVREADFEPRFVEVFNQYSDITIERGNEDADYTLVVKVNRIEPGFHAGVVRKNAEIDFNFTVLQPDANGEMIVAYQFNEAYGQTAMGYDFTTTSRVRECFALGGKRLAKKLEKDRG